ncbi:putative zinc ribbon protein [Citrobacter amalonaticus]
MLLMPCYCALNTRGEQTGSRSAASQPEESWTCPSCGCRLVLHSDNPGIRAWFEHDQRSVGNDVLRQCKYRDDFATLPGDWHTRFIFTFFPLDVSAPAAAWYCAACNTGIYSIEETAWRESYICPVDEPAQPSSGDQGGN